MNLIKKLIPDTAKCATGEKFKDGEPSVITIHWIGPYPGQTPSMVRDWWISSDGEASAHFIVKDSRVLQCWDTDTVAWHAGCSIGNKSSIGIEVCPCNEEGEFSDETIATLKELLDTLPKLPIVRHFDWTGKECPKYYCNKDRWLGLLDRLGRSSTDKPVTM